MGVLNLGQRFLLPAGNRISLDSRNMAIKAVGNFSFLRSGWPGGEETQFRIDLH